MLQWRANPLWYVFAVTCAAAIGAVVLVGKGFYTGKGLAVFELTPEVPFYPHLLPTILIGSFIAEMVWVSYAMNQLKSRVSLYTASQITGIAWSLWWMPMVYFNIGVMARPPPAVADHQHDGRGCCRGLPLCEDQQRALRARPADHAQLVRSHLPGHPETGGIPTYVAFSIVYWVVGTALFVIFRPGREKNPVSAVAP